jgi:hypothetical protein
MCFDSAKVNSYCRYILLFLKWFSGGEMLGICQYLATNAHKK